MKTLVTDLQQTLTFEAPQHLVVQKAARWGSKKVDHFQIDQGLMRGFVILIQMVIPHGMRIHPQGTKQTDGALLPGPKWNPKTETNIDLKIETQKTVTASCP
eukprot:Selendium_serpulae@DN9696_c0_g1_i1.p2